MLEIKNVSFRLAGNLIFSLANAYIPSGSKVGIVGRNGVGKTTLFKLINKEYSVESGEIKIKKDAKVGGVSQEVPNGSDSLISTVISADLELKTLLEEEKKVIDAERIAVIQERLSDIDGYSAEARASTILTGLGFDHIDQYRSCNEFSGGWQMRVALASVLFSEPDLLLLDEPTNYLDLEGSTWLESFLSKYSKTVILISHDRSILTRSVNKILHLENKKLTLFSGNYDFFIKSYNEIIKLEQSAMKKQGTKKAHMQAFVDKFRAKASKAKQAQSRLKALEKMQLNPQLRNSKVASFFIPSSPILAPPIINLSNVSIGYNEKIILKDLNLRIDPEDRIALLGANGQGKSTFSKLIAEKLMPKYGRITKSSKLQIGYFSQNLSDVLIPTETAFEHLASKFPDDKKGTIISKLALGGLSADQISIPIRNLSGGQKARLAMLLATLHAPHLLVLDEPTNHLDIESREALALSLNNFSGAIILVSHDPYLIELVATELWLVKNGGVSRFKADLNAYQTLLLTGNIKTNKINVPKKDRETNFNVKKILLDKKALEKQIVKAETRIQKLQEMRWALNEHLSDPNLYSPSNKARLIKLESKDIELNKAIKLAEKIWIDISEKLEQNSKA